MSLWDVMLMKSGEKRDYAKAPRAEPHSESFGTQSASIHDRFFSDNVFFCGFVDCESLSTVENIRTPRKAIFFVQRRSQRHWKPGCRIEGTVVRRIIPGFSDSLLPRVVSQSVRHRRQPHQPAILILDGYVPFLFS